MPVRIAWPPESEPAEAAAERDVGERVAPAVAPRAALDLLRHLLAAAAHARELLVAPILAALLRVPHRLVAHQQPGVEHAVGERLPAAHGNTVAHVFRDQAADRRRVVEKLDDDARIVERRAVVEHERGDLAERVVGIDRVVDRGNVDRLQLAFDFLLGEDDAHLARVRAGGRGEELHAGRGLYLSDTGTNTLPERRDDAQCEPRVVLQPQLVAPARMRQREKFG